MQRILNKRERIIFLSTVGVIVLSLVFNFVVAPVLSENETLSKEIMIAKARLDKYTWLVSKKDLIKSKYARFSAQESTNAQESGKDSLVSTLTELENFARDANIRITDLRPQAQRSLELYKELLIEMKAEGTVEGYLKFIYNIENSLSLLRIKKLHISAKPNSQGLECSFSILKFTIPD